MTLAAGRPLGVEGDVLRIGLESESMRRSVQGRESLELLGRLASDAAGRPLRVEIGPLPAERQGETSRARARQREQETLADPLVQAAVEIFGGEVFPGLADARTAAVALEFSVFEPSAFVALTLNRIVFPTSFSTSL